MRARLIGPPDPQLELLAEFDAEILRLDRIDPRVLIAIRGQFMMKSSSYYGRSGARGRGFWRSIENET